MSIYKELLDTVSNGKKFKVDLKEKSLWINKKEIIKKGEIVDEQNKSKDLIESEDLLDYGWTDKLNDNPWLCIKCLYQKYKYSAPKENSNKKSYFKALSVDELTDAELASGFDRDLSDAMLSGYILLSSLKGWLCWEYGEHWFWQAIDKDLVVLREWVE